MLAAKLLRSTSLSPVVWLYPPEGFLGSFQIGDVVDIELSATSPNLPMEYAGHTALPDGLFLENIGDYGYLRGELQGGPPPIWATPEGLLETLGELQQPTYTLQATPQAPATSITLYTVVENGVPAGTRLNGTTGAGEGTVALLVGAEPPVENANPPVINSPADGASLGSFSEGEVVALSGWLNVSYTGIPAGVYILKGGLPQGLSMDFLTGDISGTVAELVGALPATPQDPPVVNAPTVSWADTAGAPIAPIDIGAYFSAQAGKSMSHFYICEGRAQLSLLMSAATGVLSGTSSEVGVFSFRVCGVDSSGAENITPVLTLTLT